SDDPGADNETADGSAFKAPHDDAVDSPDKDEGGSVNSEESGEGTDQNGINKGGEKAQPESSPGRSCGCHRGNRRRCFIAKGRRRWRGQGLGSRRQRRFLDLDTAKESEQHRAESQRCYHTPPQKTKERNRVEDAKDDGADED